VVDVGLSTWFAANNKKHCSFLIIQWKACGGQNIETLPGTAGKKNAHAANKLMRQGGVAKKSPFVAKQTGF
jgi:hypothetical protein